MISKTLRNEKGFTMVEMMVVLIIIAVLIAGGIKFYLGYIENSKVTKAKAQISTMQAALDTYFAENGAYPNDTSFDGLKAKMLNAGLVLTAGTVDGQDGTLNVTDPWGATSNYLYHSTNGMNYYVRSGRETVQNQNAVTAVFGNGGAGSSNAPTVGRPSET